MSSKSEKLKAAAAKRERCPRCKAYAHGDKPCWSPGAKPRPIADRIAEKAVWDGDCLIWATPSGGRPHTTLNGKKMVAPRALWVETHGPLPVNVVVRHSCDRPNCVNIEHLSIGTTADNINDAVTRGRNSRGSDRWNAIITEEDVRAIRADPRSNREVADDYGLRTQHVWKIRMWKIWKWVR